MFCGSCGKQVPEGSGFCPACGASAGGGAPAAGASTGAAGGPSAAAAQRAKLEAQFKAGSQDAVAAVKVLLSDPVGGLAKSFGMFDAARAQMVGGIFGVVYALAATIAMSIMGAAIMGLMMGNPLAAAGGFGGFSIPFSFYVKIFVAFVGQFAGLVVGCLLVRTIFKGAGNLASDIYTSGTAYLPVGIGLLAGSLLGQVHFSLAMICLVFGSSYAVLMFYCGCSKINKLSDGMSALSVPIIISVVLFACGILFKVLM
jgi:hypothetical protein